MALKKKPITLKNPVNPLDWNISIVNPNGTPTAEFQRKWLQQAGANSTIVNVTTAAGVSAVLDIISSVVGSLLVRGTTAWQGLPPAGDATMFLNGAATPAYAKVKDTDLAVTDVTGNNVSIAAHGFAPKLPNDATLFMNGIGGYTAPPSGGGATSIQDDGTTVYIALSDTDGQLVLDGSGDPIFSPEVFPASAIPAAAGYATGPYSALVVNRVKGVTDASNATAGDVGEEIKSSILVGSSVALTTAVAANLTSIVLPAGDWLVFFSPAFTGAATVCGRFIGSISLVSGTLDTVEPNIQQNLTYNNNVFSFGTQTLNVGPRRVNVNTNTTVYGVVYSEFSGGGNTCNAYGFLVAYRIR